MKAGYLISLEGFDKSYPELDPVYRQHYAEMAARMEKDGIFMSKYDPRLDEYSRASLGGWLLTFVLRFEGRAVGYSNVYLTHDMHNRDFIAMEDAIYVVPEHRNGVGKELVRHILRELAERGVKRGYVTPVTDLRVAKIWARMGFRSVAEQMVYLF